METKLCLGCGQVKSLGDFHKANDRLSGTKARCKKCVSVYQEKYRQRKLEERGGFKRRAIDISGKRFGSLVAIRRIGTAPNRSALWECKCDCGCIATANYRKLIIGKKKSCGHLAKKVKARYSHLGIGLAGLMNNYLNEAKRHKREWALSAEQAYMLFCGSCHYCGSPPVEKKYKNKKYTRKVFPHNGIDRKDNNLGYTLDNCVSCCTSCNTKKKTKPYEVFMAQISRELNT